MQLVTSDEEDMTPDDVIYEDRQHIVSDTVLPNNDASENNDVIEFEEKDTESPDVSVHDNEQRQTFDTTDIALNQPDVFEVEKVIKGRYRKNGSVEYLIHWKGYSEKDRTWEPVGNLNQAILDSIKKTSVPMLNLKYKKK
jgi:hypothetical protein